MCGMGKESCQECKQVDLIRKDGCTVIQGIFVPLSLLVYKYIKLSATGGIG